MSSKQNSKNRKLRIGYVFDDGLDRADGVQQQIKLIGSWMTARGHTVRYLVGETKTLTDINGAPVFSLARSVGISANQNRLTVPLPVKTSTITSILDQERFDVLHIMLPYSPFLGQKVATQASQRHIPMIGTFHTYPATTFQRFGSKIYGWLISPKLNQFYAITSVSEPTQQYVQEMFNVKSSVIPNGISRQIYLSASANQHIRKKKFTVVFINRLVKRKGAHYLVLAANYLNKKSQLNNIMIYICGKGPQASDLQRMITDNNLQHNVRLVGFISEQEKATYLASADVAVCPATVGEAFGIVLLEAMSIGKTVVLGGDNPGYRSVLKGHKDLIIDPTNPQSFGDAIMRAVSDPSFRAGALTWQNEQINLYDVDRVAPRILALYYAAHTSPS